MNFTEARVAIEEILASIPDSELPLFDRVEYEDGRPVVWWGSSGHCLGTAKKNGVRDPMIYRQQAAVDAIHQEMICRADKLLLDNNDNPEGVKFRNKGLPRE